jgi:hypothetical protein
MGGVLVAEKRLRHLKLGAAAYLIFQEEKTMNRKKIVIAIFALALVIGILSGIYTATRPEAQVGSKTITITVVHKDGTEKNYEFKTDAETLDVVLLDNNLVTGYEGPYGLTIESVDGETADWNVDQSYWCLYINGEYAVTGASDTKIFDGDSFSLVYTIG